MISTFSIGSVGDAARYHDKAFTHDGAVQADNYYLNEQAAAHWEGKGAELLGLAGQPVEKQDFVAFLEGRLRNPANGDVQDLADNSRGENRRAGMDFTVAPPKSVSIVALVGQDERVVAAHQAANTRAMVWLEQHAAVVRVRFNGEEPTPVQAGNLLYATVLHETNRANEPQLHNHNVIVAAVYDKEDHKWRSLTNDQLYKLRAQADVVYKAELASGLREAGYQLDYAGNSVDFEIKGFSDKQLETYSTRSEQIKAALIERGFDPDNASYAARQTAALDSRSAKQDVPREALHEIWQTTAREAGLNVATLVGAARANAAFQEARLDTTQEVQHGADQPHPRYAQRKAAMRAVSLAIEHLSEREQTFKSTNLAISALKFDRNGTIDYVDWAVGQHIKNSQLVPRGADSAGAGLVTTSKGIQAERELAANIVAGMGQGRVIVSDAAEFAAAVTTYNDRKSLETKSEFRLSAEQVIAARNVLMHRDTYQGIQGEAGTGKTAALALVREVAQAKGWQVVGMATSASAAKELEASSGIKSQTVAAFLVERENAVRATRIQISELESALSKRRTQNGKEMPQIERQRLTVEAGDVSFGEGRYVFDHKRGEVFKAGSNLASLLGNFFSDLADAGKALADKAGTDDKKLSTRLKANALNLGVGAADYLGQNLSIFERVGTVEAALARSTLYLHRDPSRDPLVRDLELKRAELFNLTGAGNREGRKTLLVMDEASLTGARDAARISALAKEIGARVVFQGDTRQHGSVPAGRSFAQAQLVGMNTSVLQETRRFDNASDQVKAALREMKVGRFGEAINMLDRIEVKQHELPAMVAQRYLSNFLELKGKGIKEPQVGIVSVTNRDRKDINAAVHDVLATSGLVDKTSVAKIHLDVPKLTAAELNSAGMLRAANVDTIVFRQNYQEIHVARGETVKVVRFDVKSNRLVLQKASGMQITMDPMKQERFTPAREESRLLAVGSRVEARANILAEGADSAKVTNGSRGVVQAIDDKAAVIKWSDGVISTLTNDHLRFVDHSYARTSYKEQGTTNHREIIAVSEIGANVFNREAAYVAASRAKDNTEIVTADAAAMLKSAGKDVTKSTSLEIPNIEQTLNAGRAKLREAESERQINQLRSPGRSLSI